MLRRLSAAVFKSLSLSMIGTSLLGGNSLFELQQTETNYWEPEKNTLQYVKHEVQTSLVEETDLKTKTMRMWCSGEVCLSGNGEERRSGESPLGRSAGLLNNKQQFFILLAPAITQPYIPLLSTDVITFIMCITSKDLAKVPGCQGSKVPLSEMSIWLFFCEWRPSLLSVSGCSALFSPFF